VSINPERKTTEKGQATEPYQSRVVRILLYTLIGLAISHFDLFGLLSAGNRTAERIFVVISAAFNETPREDLVSIVALDNDSLRAIGESGWPMSYKRHGQIISKIMRNCPRALFIDFDLQSTDPDDLSDIEDELQAAAAEISRMQNPNCSRMLERRNLFFVAPESETQMSPPQRVLVKYATPVDANFSFKALDSGLYPLLDDDSNPGNHTISPVLRMYRAYTVQQTPKKDLPDSERLKIGNFKAPMVLQWSLEEHPYQQRCTGPSYCSSVGVSFAVHGILGNHQANSAKPIQPCLSTLYMKAESLLQHYNQGKDEDGGVCFSGTGASIPEAETGCLKDNPICGRLVLYGGNIAQSIDLVRTPAHGLIPGVFFHAAALSNLVNYNEEYFYKLDRAFENILSVILTILFSVLFVVGSGLLNRMALPATTSEDDWLSADRNKFPKAAALFVLGCIVVATGFALTFVLHVDMIHLTVLALGHLAIITAVHASGLYWVFMKSFRLVFS